MNNVQDYLKVYNMTDLTRLGRIVGVKNVSTLKKDDLIESITERLQLPKTAGFAYKYIDERTFSTWQRAAEEGIDVTQENYSLEDVFGLYIMGYAFEDPDNEDEFFLTPTVQNLFSEVDGEDNREARLGIQRHLNLIRAALHLYGIVSFGELIHLFKKYYDETITGDGLVEFLEQSPYDITIDEEKEEIVIDDMNDEQYEMVKQLQGDRPYYEPEFAKFIKFSSPYYIDESEYHRNLKQFVRDRMVTDESEVETSYIDILQLIMSGSKRNEIVDFLMEKDVEFNDEEEQRKFFEDIAGIVENTRHFKYRGHKESELKTKTIVKEIKVGRNDPCPCGSGKKYKKCCGA